MIFRQPCHVNHGPDFLFAKRGLWSAASFPLTFDSQNRHDRMRSYAANLLVQGFACCEAGPRQQHGCFNPATLRHLTARADPGIIIHRGGGDICRRVNPRHIVGRVAREVSMEKESVRCQQRLWGTQVRPHAIVDHHAVDFEPGIDGAGKLQNQGKNTARWGQEIQKPRANQSDTGELEPRPRRTAQVAQVQDRAVWRNVCAFRRADHIAQSARRTQKQGRIRPRPGMRRGQRLQRCVAEDVAIVERNGFPGREKFAGIR